MSNKKRYIGVFVFLILYSFSFTSKVEATAPSVIDCLKEDAACEENGAETTPKNEEQTEQDAQASVVGKNGSLLFSIVKMVFALLLVLALIYLLIKFLSKRNKLFHQVKALENLGGISVGQQKSIQVVRIGSKVFLVGVGENVELLQEITDEQVKHDLLHKDENEANESLGSNWLTSFLQQKQTGVKTQTNDFKQFFTNELDKLKQNRKKLINQHKQKEDEHE